MLKDFPAHVEKWREWSWVCSIPSVSKYTAPLSFEPQCQAFGNSQNTMQFCEKYHVLRKLWLHIFRFGAFQGVIWTTSPGDYGLTPPQGPQNHRGRPSWQDVILAPKGQIGENEWKWHHVDWRRWHSPIQKKNKPNSKSSYSCGGSDLKVLSSFKLQRVGSLSENIFSHLKPVEIGSHEPKSATCEAEQQEEMRLRALTIRALGLEPPGDYSVLKRWLSWIFVQSFSPWISHGSLDDTTGRCWPPVKDFKASAASGGSPAVPAGADLRFVAGSVWNVPRP